jgi:hypothetical protein
MNPYRVHGSRETSHSFQARQVKLNLRENLHENGICQNPASNGADAASVLACKSFLKKLSRKMLRFVQNEMSIAGLRSKLQVSRWNW